MKAYVLCSYLITIGAALFARWIIRKMEEPEILINAAAAIGCVCVFILLFFGVMELCAYVM